MGESEQKRGIVILDFGGQYAHLIARRVRECGVYSEILPPETSAEDLTGAAGIILSGGPQSVYDEGSPQADKKIFDLGIPVLGICYGHQWIAHALGGEVKPGSAKEYGPAEVELIGHGNEALSQESLLFHGIPKKFSVWMSHGDEVTKLPGGFHGLAKSPVCAVAAMGDLERRIFGVQFHLEVTHTEHGLEILKHFVEMCDAQEWSIEGYAKRLGEEILKEAGDRHVFMLVSGGVDSTVAFTLLNEVLGKDRVQGLLIDTGLMRKNEVQQIRDAFNRLGITNLDIEDASEEFFRNLTNVYDPEEKRKIMGQTFLDVQQRVLKRMKLPKGTLLGQGTIYPDTIETGGTKHSDHIKTHHNRVEAIATMIEQGLVIEPLKELYKDEVREIGEELGLPHELVWRHPFPGPGLGVRILCTKDDSGPASALAMAGGQMTADSPIYDILHTTYPYAVLPIKSVGVQGDGRTYRHAVVLFSKSPTEVTPVEKRLATDIPNRHKEFNRVLLCTSQSEVASFVVTPGFLTRERADLLREADAIVDEEMRRANLYEVIWQFPVVLLPVGIKRNSPSFAEASEGRQSIVLRPVESTEAMTANAALLPKDVLGRMTDRIMKLTGIDMVMLDLTDKPPATIEWE